MRARHPSPAASAVIPERLSWIVRDSLLVIA